ncbi:MAG: sodium:solute symporter, partial [Verrucomicrobiae bacterium]|nr:sodium:solute symporter [Verrucomicrobiae bacterium]
MTRLPLILLAAFTITANTFGAARLDWSELPALPDALGVAGPFAGVHNDALIVAGGANFKTPIWETDKTWYDEIRVLEKAESGYRWHEAGNLPRRTAYGMAVSTEAGVVCIGGNDGIETFTNVVLLAWNSATKQVEQSALPALPGPCAYGQATLLNKTIYVAGGQSGNPLDTAMNNLWALDLNDPNALWRELAPWPGPARAFNLTAAQHNGFHDCVYVMSGRRQAGADVEFLKDVWEFSPSTGSWRKRSDMPHSRAAGTAIRFGQSHVFVLGGADGTLWDSAAELGDRHPGFPKEAWTYHTITDRWASAGTTPANHVTTVPVNWNGRLIVPSGEVRPRVRSPKIWSIKVLPAAKGFGAVNYVVLFTYLALMVGIGVYFTGRNKNTDDFFRGGKQIAWWAAGCSIFATM